MLCPNFFKKHPISLGPEAFEIERCVEYICSHPLLWFAGLCFSILSKFETHHWQFFIWYFKNIVPRDLYCKGREALAAFLCFFYSFFRAGELLGRWGLWNTALVLCPVTFIHWAFLKLHFIAQALLLVELDGAVDQLVILLTQPEDKISSLEAPLFLVPADLQKTPW